jgi:hypothetical protein
MQEIDDPTKPSIKARLIFKYSLRGRWRRWRRRFWMRGRKKMLAYGLGLAALLWLAIAWLVLA